MFELEHDELDTNLVIIRVDKTELPDLEALVKFLDKKIAGVKMLRYIEDMQVKEEIKKIIKGK